MQLPPYIDIHTHRQQPEEGVLAIRNRQEHFAAAAGDAFYSMGVHPWHIAPDAGVFSELAQAARQRNVLAIGECGLDALKGAPLPEQAVVFERQIGLANELGKPLMIHCVRAFPQALQLLAQATVPVLFHGFNKKRSVAQQVLDAGHYLSFGADLLRENSAAAAALASVPPGRFFLETDDQPVSIRNIYKIAAAIRKTAEDEIILQLQKNFKTVFNC